MCVRHVLQKIMNIKIKRQIIIALCAFFLFFVANRIVAFFSDPFTGVYQAVEDLTGYDQEELFFSSGGYHPTFFGWRSEAVLWSRGDDPEIFRVTSVKAVHMIPWWSLESFSREPKAEQASDGNAEKPPGGERES